MSRKQGDHDYNLRSMSNLMGERWKKVNDGGERSLIKAPSSASISSQGASASASTAAPQTAPSPSTGDLERAARKQFQQDVTPGFVYVLAVFSALGGFLFGYDTGVISGAMLLLKRELELNALWQEVLISSTVAAAALSALLGGFLNGLFGRRVCILLASFFFTAGGIVMCTAPGKEALLAGRLIVGVGLGKTCFSSTKMGVYNFSSLLAHSVMTLTSTRINLEGVLQFKCVYFSTTQKVAHGFQRNFTWV